jgi:hypothetical protein
MLADLIRGYFFKASRKCGKELKAAAFAQGYSAAEEGRDWKFLHS